ncbi:Glu-tRNA(Gln) amidotransferase subunit GatD [Candidatus Woesearchaeota archaeon]|nr:Glu-tRNA(Gln) amidotransferase subunit GatD [Candidatus Woesearchaeota archaeon]
MGEKPGDKIRVVCDKEEHVGILINKKKDVTVVKLENGYNVGIENKKIKKIEVLEEGKEIEIKYEKKAEKKKGLPNISILHTGGTIASKVDYRTGGVYASFKAEDFLGMFPEVGDIANISSKQVLNVMSEDILFKDYVKLAEAVKKEIDDGAKGVIIGHGTDTIAMTSAALAFIFEKVPIPVLLVGAQRSSDRGSSDAAMNLVCAAEFIAKTDFAGVALCMHESAADETCVILPATKTRKMHTSRRDAFKAIDDKPIARIEYKTRKIKFLKDHVRAGGNVLVKNKFEDKVAIIKTYPNMKPHLIDALIDNGYKGLVLEATGIGQAPTNIEENLPNYEALKKFISKGGVIVLTSQCIFGRVHPDIYTNCRRLKDIGIIFGEDMLTETAFVKLAWLLGNYNTDDTKKMLTENLRGEINPQISEEDYLEE